MARSCLVRFETYQPIISLILQFFSGRGKPWITETTDTGAQLYMLHTYPHKCILFWKIIFVTKIQQHFVK
jgi:hypothetical protein